MGAGTIKIIKECKQAGIPEPVFSCDSSDISVEFRKDIYNAGYLFELGLNDRQVKAVLFAKENGKISNRDYQELNSVSKRTATNELTDMLNNFKILMKTGTRGAGISYKIIGQ